MFSTRGPVAARRLAGVVSSRSALASSSRASVSVKSFATSTSTYQAEEVTPRSASTLSQFRSDAAPQASSSSTDNVRVRKEEEPFVLPNCLQATQSLPTTHGVHVATLQLRSYSDAVNNLDLFADFARKAAFSIGIPASGVVHLPTRTSLWTVPRSPFVHKKSQENFWRKTHSRAIKLFDANDEVVDRWLHFLRIHAMAGVGMKAELFRYHEPGVGAKLMEEANTLQRKTVSSTSTDATAAAVDSSAGSGSEGQTAEQSAENIKKIADGIVEKEMEQDKAGERAPNA